MFRLIFQQLRRALGGFLTDQADPEDFAPPAPGGREELRAYPLGTFCFSQSARNFFKPMSVRGCWTSCLKTANGMVQMSPPILAASTDRKSTRLNSSHLVISYAVFCLKKKKRAASPSAYCKRPS